MAYIAAWMGKSKRTAERAVRVLKDRGLIHVVKYGYKSHGVGQASVYMLADLSVVHPPPKMADARANMHPPDSPVHPPNPDMHLPNRPHASATQDGGHDGNYDGVTHDGVTPPGLTHDGGLPPARAPAREDFGRSAVALVEEWIPGPLRLGGAKRLLVELIRDALQSGLDEGRVLDAIADWLSMPNASAYSLSPILDAALNGEGGAR
jgi:hypothetical protein